MLLKDPGEISSVLNFLSKKLDQFEVKQNTEEYQKTKKILGIERIEEKNIMMFYNFKCKEFDGRSLVQYINLENERMSKQREELIDLSVKIANLNHTRTTRRTIEEAKVVVNTEKAEEEVINNYKSGLPSGVGLRDMIKQIKERYPWSSSKKIIMILLSLMTCLFGVGLYALDLATDVQFSLEMFYHKTPESVTFDATFSSFLSKNGLKFPSIEAHSRALECLTDLEEEFDKRKKRTSIDFNDYRWTSLFSIWHCIQPFAITVIVFISMKCCKGGKLTPYELGNLKDPLWWGANTVLCCIPNLAFVGSVLPIPAFTNPYRFYLDVNCHITRSRPDFSTKIVKFEQMIRKHEVIGKL